MTSKHCTSASGISAQASCNTSATSYQRHSRSSPCQPQQGCPSVAQVEPQSHALAFSPWWPSSSGKSSSKAKRRRLISERSSRAEMKEVCNWPMRHFHNIQVRWGVTAMCKPQQIRFHRGCILACGICDGIVQQMFLKQSVNKERLVRHPREGPISP